MLTPRYTFDQLRRKMNSVRQQLDKKIIRLLSYLGEQCVAKARSLRTYQDQTGNLRASIGYVILRDGQVVKKNFTRPPASKKRKRDSAGRFLGGDEKQGDGEQYATTLLGNYPRGYVLIVVAGMEYAAKVESRGFDVLTGTKQYARAELPVLLQSLKIR